MTPTRRSAPAKPAAPPQPPAPARVCVVDPHFREDLAYWVQTDRNMALRALELVEAIMRDPFTGIGKPEPLRHELAGAWSRRLTHEHRIVYLVSQDRIDFLQARYQY